MDLSAPHQALAPSLDLEVLVQLARTTEPLSARSVRLRSARGSDRGVRLALERLTRHGLVTANPTPSATFYALNRDHVAAPAVDVLLELRTTFLDRLRTLVDSWSQPPMHLSIFGSYARRDGDAESDIDLLVVRPSTVSEDAEPWSTQLEILADRVRRWTGNRAEVSEIGESDLARLRTDRPSIVAELERDAIDVAGTPVRKLLQARG